LRLHPYDPIKSQKWYTYDLKRKIADLKGLVRKTRRQGYFEEAQHYQNYLDQFIKESEKERFIEPEGFETPSY
jgi:hypothetical protein